MIDIESLKREIDGYLEAHPECKLTACVVHCDAPERMCPLGVLLAARDISFRSRFPWSRSAADQLGLDQAFCVSLMSAFEGGPDYLGRVADGRALGLYYYAKRADLGAK